MTTLTRGANAPLTVGAFAVEVSAGRALDVSALLLTADGKVRSDADFVFYNAPVGPGVRHIPATPHSPDAITIDTTAIPPDIDKIVVTASLDDAGETFAGTTPLANLRDLAGGAVFVTFTPVGLGPETALILVEIYRRSGQWKVRGVGQGYANGLAGIATDFGITVDDEPAPPPAAPPPFAPPPAAPPVAAPAGRLNLDKGRISLTKRQSVSLVKGGRPLLSVVRMALGWDPAPGRQIDLDASCIAYDGQRKKIASCSFMKLTILNGAIRHSGDNLTGAGSGDDEIIAVDLGALPPNVLGLVFTVNSFSGHKFSDVRNAYCRLVDASTDAELVRFDLSDTKPHTGVAMCKLVREQSGWVMTALGEFVDAKTVRGMVKPAAQLL